jgi:predicted nucleotidyltransferase component of viral defense system
MTPDRRPTNIGASVRARLLNLSRERGVEFQRLLSEFAIERLLFRLGTSTHAGDFVLKGATLFKFWSGDLQRATWDVDLLSRSNVGVSEMVSLVKSLCSIDGGEDGIVFDAESLTGEAIAEEARYAGVRVQLDARLAEARIPVQLDIGMGDVVLPAPSLASYPTLLDHPSPRILVYPREAVVAEKLEAIVSLGITNSRMKDFYDLRQLAASSSFDGSVLGNSVRTTFDHRGTPLPDSKLLVLQAGFLSAPDRQVQWRAFLRRSRLSGPEDAGVLETELRSFVLPLVEALAKGERFARSWPPGGPW